MSDQTKYQKHYQKYRDSIRKSQKIYYDKNADKIKAYHRAKYNNDTVYKDKRKAEMRRYQNRKRIDANTTPEIVLSR